jgi:hypothetical protein
MTPAEKILSCLDRVKENGHNKWMACCPAHDDGSPSLSIKSMDDGRVLLHCFAGCSASDVVAAVGMSLSDLFEAPLYHKAKGVHWKPSMPAADALRALVKDAYAVGIIAANMNDFGEISDEDRAMLVSCIARMDNTLIASGVQR